MKTTPEELAKWKALVPKLNDDSVDHMVVANSTDMPPQHTVNFQHAKNAHEAARAIPALIADLEEAQRRISISEAFAKELSSELITTRKQLEELRTEYSVTLDNLSAAYESVRAQWNLGYAEGSQEVKHWRANHDNVVAKLRLFTQREDLPVDRLPAYEYVMELENKLAEAQSPHINIAHSYVQEVPDHCDRITWRGRYFHLHGINSIVAIDAALDAAIAEAIEPYRKDAERWREYVETLKSPVGIEGINVRVSAQRIDGSIYAIHHAIRPLEYINDEAVAERVGQRLSREILAAIAAKGESE